MSTTNLVGLSGVLFGLGLGISLGICWMGYNSYRRWRGPGTGAFGAFVLTLGVGGVLGGVVSILYTPVVGEQVVWSRIAFQLFVLVSVPWGVFALQYTGTYRELSGTAILLLLLPIAVFFGLSGFEWVAQIENPALVAVVGGIGALISVYHIGLFALGIFLVARTVYEYDHLPLRLGAVLVFVPLVTLLAINIVLVSGVQVVG